MMRYPDSGERNRYQLTRFRFLFKLYSILAIIWSVIILVTITAKPEILWITVAIFVSCVILTEVSWRFYEKYRWGSQYENKRTS